MNEPLYCVNHPKVETVLRCNKCGRPICPKCAVRTPVGYRCRDCVRNQQKVFYAEFRPSDYLIAAAVAIPLGLLAAWLITQLSWYTIILGPLAGGGIANLAHRAVGLGHMEGHRDLFDRAPPISGSLRHSLEDSRRRRLGMKREDHV